MNCNLLRKNISLHHIDKIVEKAKELGADYALFGHTHLGLLSILIHFDLSA